MKRVYVVWIILAFVILMCVFGLWSTYDSTATMTQKIETIAQKIENGDLSEAQALSQEAEQAWGQCHRSLCTFMGHERLEIIDRELAALPIALAYGEESQAAVQCAQLIEYMEQLKSTEVPLLENIL